MGPGKEFDHIGKTGVRWIRRGFHWQGIEKKEGEYDFEAFDKYMAEMDARGIGVIFILAYNNKLYESNNREIVTEVGRKGFAEFAAASVHHFKGRNIIWEIWNEPNTKAFWGAPPNSERIAADYVKLVKATVPAMRKTDPNCVILAGSVSNLWKDSYRWMEYAFKQGVLETDIDGWSVHPYGLKRPEDYFEAYNITRELMRKHGKSKKVLPLLNTERGFPIKDAEGFAGGNDNISKQEEYQAGFLVRQYLIDILCDVRITIWYDWNTDEFGLIGKGKERPAYRALQTLVAELGGFKLSKRIPTASDLDFVLLFESDLGQQKLVAWTASPKGQNPDQTVVHTIMIPKGSLGGNLEVVDVDGKRFAASIKGTEIELTLTGSPQYLGVAKGAR